MEALPPEIGERVSKCAILLEPVPSENDALPEDAEDLLGIFEGDALGEGGSVVPPRIVLWLENIYDFSGGDSLGYREEVRTTLLHEIGHYLGWDEDDLEARDLG